MTVQDGIGEKAGFGMMQRKRKETDKESGVVVVEAVYVVVIAVLLIFFSVNVSVVYHNRLVVTAAANEAASGVAEVYGCVGREPFYAYVSPAYFKGRNVYRYLNFGLEYENDTLAMRSRLNTSAQEKGKWYASYLLSRMEYSTAGMEERMNFDGVSVVCGTNGIGMQTLTVTIRREYPVFILNPVSFFGLEPAYTVEASGTAVCYDVIHQMNAVSFTREWKQKLDPSEDMSEWMNDVLELVRKVVSALNL